MTRLSSLALGVFALSGCAADGDDVLLILRNQAPAEGCVLSTSESAPFAASGTINPGPAPNSTGYLFTPLVKNLASTTSSGTSAQRTVVMQGANVTIDFVDDDLFSSEELQAMQDNGITRTNPRFAGAVDPNGGVATFAFEVLSGAAMDAIAAKITDRTTIIADIVVYGEMSDSRVESQVFSYPIEVCLDCLVVDVGLCSELPNSFEASEGGACRLNQDGLLQCCGDGAGGVVCPAAPPTL